MCDHIRRFMAVLIGCYVLIGAKDAKSICGLDIHRVTVTQLCGGKKALVPPHNMPMELQLLWLYSSVFLIKLTVGALLRLGWT